MARVLIIAGFGPSLVRFRGPLIQAMVGRGHEVVAMSPDPKAPPGLAELGARYIPWDIERKGTRPDRDVAAILALARRIRQVRPDVVFAYTVKPVIYGTLAAWLARVPRRYAMVTGLGYLFIGDGTLRQRVLGRLARPLYRAGLARAHAVIVQNPDDEADLRAAGLLRPDRPVHRVSGSGVRLDDYPLQPLPHGDPVFLFVGRLLVAKGVRELVEAARLVRARWPAARFQIVGGGEAGPGGFELDEVEAWRAEGIVELVGEQADVRPFLAGCSVFVLPSHREGTPRSVLEAMSTGRAVITTDAPGCRETTVDGVNGFLVPVDDPASLASAMERYLRLPALIAEHGRAGRRRAEEIYDVERVNEDMLRILGL